MTQCDPLPPLKNPGYSPGQVTTHKLTTNKLFKLLTPTLNHFKNTVREGAKESFYGLSEYFKLQSTFLSHQANAIGRSAKTVREFLEKHYTDEVADSDDETIKLAIKALLEVRFVASCIFYIPQRFHSDKL